MRTSIRKKIMPVLLALALITGFFPILSVPVQAAGETRTTTLDLSTQTDNLEDTDEGWSWDYTNNTLTLSGVNIRSAVSDSGDTYAIKLPAGAKIELEAGTTNIVCAGNSSSGNSYGISGAGTLTIQGSGTLDVSGGTANFYSFGIYSAGAIEIKGSAAVSATGGTAGDGDSSGIYSESGAVTIGSGTDSPTVTATGGTAGSNSTGIYGCSAVTIDGGAVTARGGSAEHSYGICSYNTTISGGAVTATGGTATGGSAVSYGIYGYAGVTIEGGTVTATGGSATDSYGIYGNSGVTISTGTVTATGGTAINSCGITGVSVTVTSGTVTATGGTATDSSGIVGVNVTVTSGTVTATGGTAGTTSSGIHAVSTLALNGGLIITQSTSTTGTAQAMNTAASGTLSTALTGSYTAKFAVYGAAAAYPAGNISTTAIDCTSYTGNETIISGVAIWTQSTKTLTITNLILNTTDKEAITLPEGATLELVGTSVIRSGDVTSGDSTAVYGMGALAIDDVPNDESDGALFAIGGTATGQYRDCFGICASTVTISSGTVTAIGNSANSESCGIWGSLEVNISGGTVTAMSGSATLYSYGICSWNDNNTGTVTISGGTVTAVGGTNTYCSYGIYGTTAANISGGTVTATGGTVTGSSDGGSYGIYSEAAIGIEGGTVTATGGTANNDHSYGILGALSITINSGTVTATGGTTRDDSSYGIRGTSITINSGTVTATGGTVADDNSCGIFGTSAITINSGSVTATGGTTATDNSYGLYAYNSDDTTATVSITGGTVTATGGTASGTYTIGIYGKTSVAISGGMVTASGGTSTGTYSVGIFSADSFAASGASTVITAQSGTGAYVCAALAAGSGDSDNIAFNDGLGVFDPAAGVVIPYGGAYYTISADDTNSPNGAEPATYVVIKVLFVTGIEIKTAPTKVTYTAGDALDLSGLVVTLTKSSGSTQDVAFADFAANGLTTAPANGAALTTADTAVTITHTASGKTASQTITVNAAADEAGLPYYVDSEGNDVFIGFAANGQYIAPDGVTVLVKQNAKSFTDIDSHWAEGYIDFVTERELFVGTGSNMFSPDTGMTRAMFATVIGRLYERSYGEIEAADTHFFTDCDYDDYYGKYVDWAAEEGVIGGYGNGEFGPKDQISREQIAAILYRFADFLGVIPADIDSTLDYPDAGDISSWAQSAALYCQSTGIITGRDGGNFAPQGTATRAEAAVILERFIENVLD